MKLQLKIDNCGTGYKLVTPDGEEIEGVEEVIFLEREKDGFQSVLVRFAGIGHDSFSSGNRRTSGNRMMPSNPKLSRQE
jgi:hypothetical protein